MGGKPASHYDEFTGAVALSSTGQSVSQSAGGLSADASPPNDAPAAAAVAEFNQAGDYRIENDAV